MKALLSLISLSLFGLATAYGGYSSHLPEFDLPMLYAPPKRAARSGQRLIDGHIRQSPHTNQKEKIASTLDALREVSVRFRFFGPLFGGSKGREGFGFSGFADIVGYPPTLQN